MTGKTEECRKDCKVPALFIYRDLISAFGVAGGCQPLM